MKRIASLVYIAYEQSSDDESREEEVRAGIIAMRRQSRAKNNDARASREILSREFLDCFNIEYDQCRDTLDEIDVISHGLSREDFTMRLYDLGRDDYDVTIDGLTLFALMRKGYVHDLKIDNDDDDGYDTTYECSLEIYYPWYSLNIKEEKIFSLISYDGDRGTASMDYTIALYRFMSRLCDAGHIKQDFLCHTMDTIVEKYSYHYFLLRSIGLYADLIRYIALLF